MNINVKKSVIILFISVFLAGFGIAVKAQKNIQLQAANPCTSSLLGIENLKKSNSSIIVFPNPNNGSFTIGIKSEMISEKAELRIFNSLGTLLLIEEFKPVGLQYNELVNAKDLPDGIYLIQFFDGFKLYSERLIINK